MIVWSKFYFDIYTSSIDLLYDEKGHFQSHAVTASSPKSKKEPNYPIVQSLHSFGSSPSVSSPEPGKVNRALSDTDSSSESFHSVADPAVVDIIPEAMDIQRSQPMNRNLSIVYTKLKLEEGEPLSRITIDDFKYPENIKKMDSDKLF